MPVAVPVRQPPVERIERVERVTERVVEPAGPDLSGPLAAVEKIARRALARADEATQAVSDGIQAVTQAAEQVREQVAAMAAAPPVLPPEPVRVEVPVPVGPAPEEIAQQMQEVVAPLAEQFESLRGELRERVTGLSRIASEAKSDAKHAASVAASAMSRDIPQPPVLPDFLVGVRIVNGRLVGVMQSGKTKDFDMLPKPRIVSGGGRASSAQEAAWSATSGGGDVMLTYSAPVVISVSSTATTLAAASAATFRRVTIWVAMSADAGVYINPAGTATTSHFLLQPGGSRSYDTNQAISAIKAGGDPADVYVQIGVSA